MLDELPCRRPWSKLRQEMLNCQEVKQLMGDSLDKDFAIQIAKPKLV